MGDQMEDFSSVVETLVNMFGSVISRDVIFTIVDSCGGDLNIAAEAVVNITSDLNTNQSESSMIHDGQVEATDNLIDLKDTVQSEPIAPIGASTSTTSEIPVVRSKIISFAEASKKSAGAIPKPTRTQTVVRSPKMDVSSQLQRIIDDHKQGSRILILMRGVPGSGKTYLAKDIIKWTIGQGTSSNKIHIYSSDDYFTVRGVYVFEKNKLGEAHEWNQNRVKMALVQGVSPIIVDNTNVHYWEMEPYLRNGVAQGYIIEVVQPNTPWAFNLGQLVKRNSHNVPGSTIKRMLENYEKGITGEFLIRIYGLSYPAHMIPPVLRNIPVINKVDQQEKENSPGIVPEHLTPLVSTVITKHEEISSENTSEGPKIPTSTLAHIERQLEETEKVVEEWETGESWDGEPQNVVSSTSENSVLTVEPKPPRWEEGDSADDKILENIKTCDDWQCISMFMPPWQAPPPQNVPAPTLLTDVENTKSCGTCIEIGDTDINSGLKIFKILTSSPRDINLFHFSNERQKIPDVLMLDKSTITNDLLIMQAYRCQNEEQHFVAFRRMFKNISKAALRDVFDQCVGDVNWAVDIILGGLEKNQLEILNSNEVSDSEDEMTEQCSCLAAYNIIPDIQNLKNPGTFFEQVSPDNATNKPHEPNITEAQIKNSVPPKRKLKIGQSDASIQLKRELEHNVVISDQHYSPHCLKIRKFRRGEDVDEGYDQAIALPDNPEASSSLVETKDFFSTTDEEESNSSSIDDAERTINVDVGVEFINQLDEIFGRNGMTYPDNIVPKISIPISLLNEINAFWMESLMHQLDEHEKQNARMIKEDQEFAIQLELKEAELANAGKEPEVPDFKEIMDMDFALSLYQKDVAEWRNKEPTDMAARMSRDKLYNLFPEMDQDVLSELLMAHDNNFQATVEVLLMSMGKTSILEEKNGLNKFIMQKEMERQEKLLEEERKALSEVEWPLLPKGVKIEMETVNGYREEAEKHLARRNLNYQKAQDYIRRGMTQAANYFSDIATFHKLRFEQANSRAAATLMQVHAANSPDNATIDLHFLRVGEAKETLDLFLDSHIQKLRESLNRGPRYHTLFFITGRGLHSNGRPRVKPAVKKRLRERGLINSERNPGLLTAKVCAEDKLSHEIAVVP